MPGQFRIHRLTAVLAIASFAIFSARVFAQQKPSSNKKENDDSLPAREPATVARGQIVYKDRCAICHFSESDVQKIGPGLKGIYRRGKFAGGGKVDDASMEDWILQGGKNMPPFKLALNPGQVRDLIAYLRSL